MGVDKLHLLTFCLKGLGFRVAEVGVDRLHLIIFFCFRGSSFLLVYRKAILDGPSGLHLGVWGLGAWALGVGGSKGLGFD